MSSFHGDFVNGNNMNNNQALPGSTPFGIMEAAGVPPIIQNYTAPCSNFIFVRPHPGNYSIEMTYGPGGSSFRANISRSTQYSPQAQLCLPGVDRVPTPDPGPSRSGIVHPQIMDYVSDIAEGSTVDDAST